MGNHLTCKQNLEGTQDEQNMRGQEVQLTGSQIILPTLEIIFEEIAV